jgi:hypothetical protein
MQNTRSELKVQWVDIDPAMAQEFLETMRVNRPLSTANLKKIQADMVNGRWHQDGDPVRFDTAGALIDGQHRMWSIIETGLTFPFLVIEGVALEAMSTMDTGKSRSISDIIGLYDPHAKDLASLAAATTVIHRWESGVRGPSLRNFSIANDDVLTFYQANKLALGEATHMGRRVSRSVPGATSQSFSLAAWLFDRIDHEDAEFFWNRLMDGSNLNEDSPIRALRELLLREARLNRNGRPRMRVDLSLAFVIKAWNAYRDGRPVKVLTYRAGGATPERFPEPC